MTKVVSVLMVLAMIVQIIRPIGLPGLARRSDFWKIAVAALLVLMLTIGLREVAAALG